MSFVLIFLTLVFMTFLYLKVDCQVNVMDKLTFQLVDSMASRNVKEISENQYHITGKIEIGIECLAELPIEIIFSGAMPHEIKYTDTEWNVTSQLYRVLIGFQNHPQATGPYSCVTVDMATTKDSLKSTIYIFADNGDEAFLLHWDGGQSNTNLLTAAPSNEENAVIPCITFRPDVQPTLKGVFQNKTTDLAEDMYGYNPSKGFLVNVTNYYTFECSIGNSSKFVFKIPELLCTVTPFDVVNENNEIKLHAKHNIFIACESLEPFKISINSKISKIKTPKESIKLHHKHVLDVELDLQNFGPQDHIITLCTVYPDNNLSKFVKKWTFVANTSEVVSYLSNYFHCYGSSAKYNSITISSVDCHNIANCDLAQRFHPSTNENATYENKYPYQIDSRITVSNKEQPNHKYLLATLPQNAEIKQGIIYCKLRPKGSGTSVVLSNRYFVDFNNKAVLYKKTTSLDVLRLSLHNDTKSVYRGEAVHFICEALTFVFAKGLEIRIGHSNGSKYYETNNSFSQNSTQYTDGYKITLNGTIKICSENITEIECRALKRETKTWMSTARKIKVKESKKPWIFVFDFPNNNETVNIKFHDIHLLKRISCSATGIPMPTIEWVAFDSKGLSIPQKSNSYIVSYSLKPTNSNTVVSSVTLPSDLHKVQYKYACIATNVVGQTNRTFVLTRITHEMEVTNSVQAWVICTISGVIIVTLLLLLTVILLCRKLRFQKKQMKLSEAEILLFLNGDQNLVNKYQELHEVAQYLPYKEHYEIHPSKIEFKNDVLGSGNCGMVMHGLLQKAGKQIPVAVKTVKPGSDISHLRTLLSEIKIMMYIGNHAHIIEMLGAMTKDLREGKLSVAIEYCSNGDLQNYLRSNRTMFMNQISNDEIIVDSMEVVKTTRLFLGIQDTITSAIDKRRSRHSLKPHQLKTTDLITWCYQVASGMEYLGTKKVIHGDLAARNLLLTEDLSVKITDFGLARHLYDYTNYVTKQKNEALPWRWLSIEAIQDCKFSTESDVWAYGVTLWEIFSLGENPYQGFSWGEEFVRCLSDGYRMGKPQYATDDIHNTMLECWNSSTEDRPSFQDIANNFKELMERVDVWTDTV